MALENPNFIWATWRQIFTFKRAPAAFFFIRNFSSSSRSSSLRRGMSSSLFMKEMIPTVESRSLKVTTSGQDFGFRMLLKKNAYISGTRDPSKIRRIKINLNEFDDPLKSFSTFSRWRSCPIVQPVFPHLPIHDHQQSTSRSSTWSVFWSSVRSSLWSSSRSYFWSSIIDSDLFF